MGPSEKAGKKVSAPTIRMTLTRRMEKSGPVTGKVPAGLGGQGAMFRVLGQDLKLV